METTLQARGARPTARRALRAAATAALACALALAAQLAGAQDAYADEPVSAAESRYALLEPDGAVYPCDEAGTRLADTWERMYAADIRKSVKALFVSPDVELVPATVQYSTHVEDDRVFNGSYAGMFAEGNAALYSVTFMKRADGTSSLAAIQDNAFNSARALKSVSGLETAPLEWIGEAAFKDSAIESVSLPPSLETIKARAFSGCASLAKVEGLAQTKCKTLGAHAFEDDASLTAIALPSGLEHTGEYTFSGCTALSSVDFGGSLRTLGSNSFYNCLSLRAVELPPTLTLFGAAFNECTNLLKVTLLSERVVATPYNQSVSGLNNTKLTKLAKGRVYVPRSVLAKYRAHGAWSTLGKKVVAIPVPKPERAANPLSVKANAVTFKAGKLKSKARAKKALSITGAAGEVTVENVSACVGAKKFQVTPKGKVKVPKGTARCAHTVTVKVKAAGDETHKPKTKKVSFTVRVK